MSSSRELERENQELAESILTAYDAIEGAIELTDFQETLTSSSPVKRIFELTGDRLSSLLPFHTIAFFQIDDENGALDLRQCRPAVERERIEELIATETASGNTHIALRDQRPMLRHIGPEHGERLLLHAICTSRRCRGLFAGIYRPGERESDRMALLLLSLILSHCANAIESAELYALLQRTNRELAGAEEFSRMRLEQTDAEVGTLLSMLERLAGEYGGEGPADATALLRKIQGRIAAAAGKREIPLAELLSLIVSRAEAVHAEYADDLPGLCLVEASAAALVLFDLLGFLHHGAATDQKHNPRRLSAEAKKNGEIEIRIAAAGEGIELTAPDPESLSAVLTEETLRGTLAVEKSGVLLLRFPVESCL